MKTNPKIVSLQSERLVLEPLEEAHAPLLYGPFCDPELYHYINRNSPPSLEWLANVFAKLVKRISPDGTEYWLNWVSREKISKQPVGYLEATVQSDKIFFAYTTFRDHWKKGYAQEGIRTLMTYLDQEYGPKTFVIEMDTRNRASTKVAESLGFRWVETIDHAATLKGFQSHEFRFEHPPLGLKKRLSPKDIPDGDEFSRTPE